MGMGYGAGYAETVDEKLVKKICPKELKAFLKAIKETKEEDPTGGKFTLESFAQNSQNGDDNPKAVELAWCDLKEEFDNKTNLSLSLFYHSSEDDGDRYDEIDGAVWSVDGVYTLTPAGVKYGKFINRKFFVHFG